MQTRLSRAEVALDTTWNLDDLFPDDIAWEAAYQAVDADCQALGAWQGRLGTARHRLQLQRLVVEAFRGLPRLALELDPSPEIRKKLEAAPK